MGLTVGLGKEGWSPKVLLVDDEFAVRDTMQNLLRYLGYEVFSVDSSLSAIDFFSAEETDATLVLLGTNVRGRRGVDCFDAIRELRPQVPIVVMSDVSEEAVWEAFAGRDVQAILKKPFRLPDLERIVRETLESA